MDEMKAKWKDTCYECGGLEGIEKHHVVPKSMGGKKTIPLCFVCHSKVHGLNRKEPLSNLIKRGMRKAKMNGKQIGRPKGTSDDIEDILNKYPDVVHWISLGYSIRVTASSCEVSPATVQKVKRAISATKTI